MTTVMSEKDKRLSKLSFYFSLRVMTTQGGVGPGAQGPHCRKNYISIERMSCCGGVIAPQSHNLWPLTPAEVFIYWNIDPLCCFPLRSCRIHSRASECNCDLITWPECQHQYPEKISEISRVCARISMSAEPDVLPNLNGKSLLFCLKKIWGHSFRSVL